MLSFSTTASVESDCHLVKGMKPNAQVPVHFISFFTYVDIFSLTNANLLKLVLEENYLEFVKREMTVNNSTRMIYLNKEDGRPKRLARVLINKTPRQVKKDRAFYGEMIISTDIEDSSEENLLNNSENLTYNFYCKF